MTRSNQETAAVAVAKDEAAYLHEWVHHYLYFGFSKIFVGLNRTSDRSREVLDRIAAKYQNLLVYDLDWIDLGRPAGSRINIEMQPIAYAYFWDEISRNFPSVKYLGYFDIDEFWCPATFRGDIASWLSEAGNFDIASFHWACQFGDKEPFLKPFANLNARIRSQQKSIMNIRSRQKLNRMRTHCPSYENKIGVVHIDANNKSFSPNQGQKALAPPAEKQRAFILHRMTRSEAEYISNLGKGMLEADTPIKTNRNGFWSTADKYKMDMDAALIQKYHSSLETFEHDCGIQELVAEARDEILTDTVDILSVPRGALLAHIHDFANVLRGTDAFKLLISTLKAAAPLSEAEIETVRQNLPLIKEPGNKIIPVLSGLIA